MTEENEGSRRLHVEGDWKAEAQAEKERLAESDPQLHVDADWKAEAQAEKERLAKADEQKPKADARQRGLPEASFKTLMSVLASQAIMGLGAVQDPQSGGVMIDLDGARFSIDLLEVLQQKTTGNLEDAEAKELDQLLTELRSRYVQVAQLVAQQAKAGGVAPAPPGGAPGPVTPG
jgi:predicted  nucleic acid-binding Zn-ribbon protein